MIFVGAFSLLRLFQRIRNTAEDFRRQMNGENREQNNYQQSSNKKETVVDHRNPDEVNKKIFSKEDGEYVDYQETK